MRRYLLPTTRDVESGMERTGGAGGVAVLGGVGVEVALGLFGHGERVLACVFGGHGRWINGVG